LGACQLRGVDAEHNHQRHYLQAVGSDLFGSPFVARYGGRRGAPGWPGSRATLVSGLEEAATLAHGILSRQRQHGHEVVAENSQEH
jgi:hypothetical protein